MLNSNFLMGVAQGFMEGKVERAKFDRETEAAENERRDELAKEAAKGFADLAAKEGTTPELLRWYANTFGVDTTGVDFAEMVNMVEDTANTTRLGQIKLPFTVDFGDEKSVFNAVNQMEQYLVQNRDSFVNMMNSDRDTKLAAQSFIGSLYNQNNLFHHNKFSKTNDDGVYTNHAYRDYQKGLPNFLAITKNLGIVETSNFATLPMQMGDMQLGEGELFIPQSFENGSVSGVIVNAEQLQQDYNTNGEMLSSLASHHNMEQGANQLFVNGDYLTYGQDSGMSPNDFYNDEDKMRSVSYGAQLAAANAQDMLLLEGGASTAVMDETVAILNKVGNGDAELKYTNEDVGAMRRAAFTITKPEAKFIGAPPNQQTEVSGVKYATDRKIDVAGFREQASATDEAVEMLRELRTLQSTYKTTGLSSKVESFVLGVVGQAQQASDLFFSRDNVADPDLFQNNLAEGTDASSLLASAERVMSKDRIQQLSRIDALRLTLAAKMARAVDPSGRLSNQDFEIQLERLGQSGLFTTQSGALERLDTVIAEFANRQKEQEDMRSILAKDRITVEDRRFIRATHLVNTAIRHRKKSMIVQDGLNLSDDSPPELPKEKGSRIEIEPGIFYDENEGVVYDAATGGNDISAEYAAKGSEKGTE
jgi:hypothetical protein